MHASSTSQYDEMMELLAVLFAVSLSPTAPCFSLAHEARVMCISQPAANNGKANN